MFYTTAAVEAAIIDENDLHCSSSCVEASRGGPRGLNCGTKGRWADRGNSDPERSR